MSQSIIPHLFLKEIINLPGCINIGVLLNGMNFSSYELSTLTLYITHGQK